VAGLEGTKEMTQITKKALRRDDIALPKSSQETLSRGAFDLWEKHLKNTYGLPTAFASAYASIRELEGLRNGR
jgi:hypothetical protein